MAEPPSPSSEMSLPRSVFNKITETVDNFKLNAVPLLALYEQWKSVESSFAMVEASLENRAKKLETDESRVESMLSEIRVREEKLKVEERSLSEKAKKVDVREVSVEECWEVIEVKNKEIEERKKELGLRETEYDERLKILEFNEKVIDEALTVKEKGIRELGEALESKKSRLNEELRSFEVRKGEIEEECRCLEAKEKGVMDRCIVLEVKEREMREEIEVLESKKTRRMVEFMKLEERERRVEENCRGLEVREKEIEERSRVQELRGKEMKELVEELEIRAKEIVEERRLLAERRKGMDGTSRGLEGRKKELDERGKEVEIREKNIKERENDMNLKEKELIELERKLELKEKDINKGFQACCEELRLKKDQLVESHRELGLKENEIVEKCKEVELKQERINEQWKVLEVKEKEINRRLKAVELKEKEINDKRVIRVNEDVDGTIKVEPNTVGFKDSNSDHCQYNWYSEMMTEFEKQVREPLNMVEFEEKQIGETSRALRLEKEINQSGRVADLKAVLIKKCTNLFKQADDVLKRQYVEGKLAEDCCNVPRGNEVISENPQAEDLAVTSVVASSLFAEIQLVFRNDDARATATYLTKYTETVSMWQKNILDRREEITGLLESLIAERKHLQAAMCTCVFKMKDVFPPDFLLNAHLEHVRERAEEIIKKASGTAQDDAANMELSALRNVLRCISDFKLESIYPPAPHELRITQLEKEMEVRTKPTKFLLKRKRNCDLGTEIEASEPTLPSPNLSAAISDSHPQRKRKASSSSSVNQNKHHRYHL
ncbi:uncharacterized protein LOC141586376 isoform X2 [Silene latifolia]|uniref:uncharacterized protein LOC141586376 isoform X2 n=1 Tax=Silene latifolia TaxID=37657 RepID=UPI003D772426